MLNARRYRTLSILAAFGLLLSCGDPGGNPTGPDGSDPPRATSIMLSKSSVMLDALGATDQITAIVKDQNGTVMAGASVTWTSSATSVAIMSGGGLVTAQGNGSAVITASVGSASAAVSVTVEQAVAAVDVVPGSADLMVNQAVALTVTLRDRNANEIETGGGTPAWSSSAPSVASVSESGIVRGLTVGSAQIQASVGGQAGSAAVVVAEASTPEVATTTVSGAVDMPASVDTTAVYVYSGVGGAASVASDGSFASASATDQEGALIAMNGGRLLGLVIQPPSSAASSPAAAAASATGVSIDARSTAVALVFLTPLFASAPPAVTQELLDLINGLPEIGALEAAVRVAVESTGGMPDESDAGFVSAYEAAVRAGHDALAGLAGVSPRELLQSMLVPDQKQSGVSLDFPAGDVTPTMTVMAQNVYGRDVDIYLTEADAEGNPRTDLSNLDSYKDHRVLQLPPADYVPDITKISEWIGLFRGNYGADDPAPLPLSFTAANSRYLVYAYGAGVVGLGSDLSALEGKENWRWVVPSAFTATFSYVLPVIEATGGFKFIPKMKLGGGYTDLRSVVETLVEVAQLFRCVGNDADPATVVICLGGEIESLLTSNPELLASVIQSAAAAAGHSLATNTIDGVLNNVLPVVKLVSFAATVGDLFVTSYAIGGSELRQEFDLSYNGLLGAIRGEVVSGDNQEANQGETLADPAVVRVLDASGNPVPNAWVEWEVVSGGGSHCACSGSTVETTDENGLSSVPWTLGGEGEQRLRARLAGFAETAVTFAAGFPVPSQLVAVSSSVTGQPGAAVSTAARVLTGTGNPVSGHDVTFTVASGHGTLSSATTRTVTTGSDGTATVSWTLPDAEGTYQITATAEYGGSPLTGSPLTITGTATTSTGLGTGFADDQFVQIAAGTFQMGSTNGYSEERPVHTVNITDGFFMQKTEVTQGQWNAVMGSNPSYFNSCGDDCPVEKVSWNDIQDFLSRLNAADPGRNYRLPTEAEWEFAARAGTTGDYGGTGNLDDMGWYSSNSGSRTHQVATKQANAWGLYDMHGNVWEWVRDWYSSSYYSVSPTDDPSGPTTGTGRVLRGGSWRNFAYYARSANRGSLLPSYRNDYYGFRLARTP